MRSSLDQHVSDIQEIGRLQRALASGQMSQMAAADDWHVQATTLEDVFIFLMRAAAPSKAS